MRQSLKSTAIPAIWTRCCTSIVFVYVVFILHRVLYVHRSLSLLLKTTLIQIGYLVFIHVMRQISLMITTSVGSFVKQVSLFLGHIIRVTKCALARFECLPLLFACHLFYLFIYCFNQDAFCKLLNWSLTNFRYCSLHVICCL